MRRNVELLEAFKGNKKEDLLEGDEYHLGNYNGETLRFLDADSFRQRILNLEAKLGRELESLTVQRFALPKGVRSIQLDIKFSGGGVYASYQGTTLKKEEVEVPRGTMSRTTGFILKRGSKLGYYQWLPSEINPESKKLTPRKNSSGGDYLYFINLSA